MRKQAIEHETEKDEYFGEVGKRYKNIPIQFIRKIASFDSVYGITVLYKIVLATGHVLTWNSSNGIKIPDERGNDIFLTSDDGKLFKNITFTVKNHKEYRGQLQTVVTRCKLA